MQPSEQGSGGEDAIAANANMARQGFDRFVSPVTSAWNDAQQGNYRNIPGDLMFGDRRQAVEDAANRRDYLGALGQAVQSGADRASGVLDTALGAAGAARETYDRALSTAQYLAGENGYGGATQSALSPLLRPKEGSWIPDLVLPSRVTDYAPLVAGPAGLPIALAGGIASNLGRTLGQSGPQGVAQSVQNAWNAPQLSPAERAGLSGIPVIGGVTGGVGNFLLQTAEDPTTYAFGGALRGAGPIGNAVSDVLEAPFHLATKVGGGPTVGAVASTLGFGGIMLNSLRDPNTGKPLVNIPIFDKIIEATPPQYQGTVGFLLPIGLGLGAAAIWRGGGAGIMGLERTTGMGFSRAIVPSGARMVVRDTPGALPREVLGVSVKDGAFRDTFNRPVNDVRFAAPGETVERYTNLGTQTPRSNGAQALRGVMDVGAQFENALPDNHVAQKGVLLNVMDAIDKDPALLKALDARNPEAGRALANAAGKVLVNGEGAIVGPETFMGGDAPRGLGLIYSTLKEFVGTGNSPRSRGGFADAINALVDERYNGDMGQFWAALQNKTADKVATQLNIRRPDWEDSRVRLQALNGQLATNDAAKAALAAELMGRDKSILPYLDPESKDYAKLITPGGKGREAINRAKADEVMAKIDAAWQDVQRKNTQYQTDAYPMPDALNPKLVGPNVNNWLDAMAASKAFMSPWWLMAVPRYYVNNALGNTAALTIGTGGNFIAYGTEKARREAMRKWGIDQKVLTSDEWVSGKQTLKDLATGNDRGAYALPKEQGIFRRSMERGILSKVSRINEYIPNKVTSVMEKMPIFTEGYHRKVGTVSEIAAAMDRNMPANVAAKLIDLYGIDPALAERYGQVALNLAHAGRLSELMRPSLLSGVDWNTVPTEFRPRIRELAQAHPNDFDGFRSSVLQYLNGERDTHLRILENLPETVTGKIIDATRPPEPPPDTTPPPSNPQGPTPAPNGTGPAPAPAGAAARPEYPPVKGGPDPNANLFRGQRVLDVEGNVRFISGQAKNNPNTLLYYVQQFDFDKGRWVSIDTGTKYADSTYSRFERIRDQNRQNAATNPHYAGLPDTWMRPDRGDPYAGVEGANLHPQGPEAPPPYKPGYKDPFGPRPLTPDDLALPYEKRQVPVTPTAPISPDVIDWIRRQENSPTPRTVSETRNVVTLALARDEVRAMDEYVRMTDAMKKVFGEAPSPRNESIKYDELVKAIHQEQGGLPQTLRSGAADAAYRRIAQKLSDAEASATRPFTALGTLRTMVEDPALTGMDRGVIYQITENYSKLLREYRALPVPGTVPREVVMVPKSEADAIERMLRRSGSVEQKKTDYLTAIEQFRGKERPLSSNPDVLYHGTRASDTASFVDEQGNLHLRPSENFNGRQVGVSLSGSVDTAWDYAGRQTAGPGRSRIGTVFEIDRDAIPPGRLRAENAEEVLAHGNQELVIPAGKWRSITDEAARSGLAGWEAKVTQEMRGLSDDTLVSRFAQDMERAEMAEQSHLNEDVGGRVAPGLSQDIVAKYGTNPEERFVINEIKRRAAEGGPEKIAALRQIAGRQTGMFDFASEIDSIIRPPQPTAGGGPVPRAAEGARTMEFGNFGQSMGDEMAVNRAVINRAQQNPQAMLDEVMARTAPQRLDVFKEQKLAAEFFRELSPAEKANIDVLTANVKKYLADPLRALDSEISPEMFQYVNAIQRVHEARQLASATMQREVRSSMLGRALDDEMTRTELRKQPSPVGEHWTFENGTEYTGKPIRKGEGWVSEGGQPINFTRSAEWMMNPPDMRTWYEMVHGDVLRSVDHAVNTAKANGPVDLTKLPPNALRSIREAIQETQAQAIREGKDSARRMLFGYDDRTTGQWLLDHYSPFSYWTISHMMQAARWLAPNPGAFAVMARGLTDWAGQNAWLPASQRWTVRGWTDDQGNEQRFNPTALFPFATNAVTELVGQRNPKDDRSMFARALDMAGVSPHFPIDLAMQAGQTYGGQIGRNLTGWYTGTGPGDERVRSLMPQTEQIRLMTGGKVDLEGGKVFGFSFPSITQLVYGTDTRAIDAYYAGIELARRVKTGDITEAAARAAILSQKDGSPNALYQSALERSLTDRGVPASARYVGLPIVQYGAERQRLDKLAAQSKNMQNVGASAKDKAAFYQANPDYSVRGAMYTDPRLLRIDVATDPYRDGKALLDAKYNQQFKDLSDALTSGKITPAQWYQSRSDIGVNKRAELDKLQKANPGADIDGTKRKTVQAQIDAENKVKGIPPLEETDAARKQKELEAYQRDLVSGYFDLQDKFKHPDGTFDSKGYAQAKDAYLAKMSEGDRAYVLGEIKKNQTAADVLFDNTPRYKDGITPDRAAYLDKVNEIYSAARYAKGGTAASGRAALAKAGLDPNVYSEYLNSRNPAYTAFFQKEGTSGANTTTSRTTSGTTGGTPRGGSTADRDAAFNEYNALKAKDPNAAPLWYAENFDRLYPAGSKTIPERPNVERVRLETERNTLLSTLSRLPTSQRQSWLEKNGPRLDTINTQLGIKSDRPYTPSATQARTTTTAPVRSGGGGGGGGGGGRAPSPINIGLRSFLQDAGGSFVQHLRDYFDGKVQLTTADWARLRQLRAKYPFAQGATATDTRWLHEVESQIR